MANSSAVSAGDLATAQQYNDLRDDVLSTTTGHLHDGVNASAYLDASDLVFGTGLDAVMRWSTGDASNHALTIGLGDSNQGLHVTDKGAVATDWNIAATTHPNLYIHSNTTPATDYLRLGDHDGTTAYIDLVGGTNLDFQIDGTSEMEMTATTLAPSTRDGLALGTTALMWADLFLASGSVVNFDNGDVTITHAANTLTVAGGNLAGIHATAAEINTGTEANKAVSPDSLAGSNLGTKIVEIFVFDITTDASTGDVKAWIRVPASLAGMDIITVHAEVATAGTTGSLDIQLRNATQTADILSTKITVDTGETGSDTAATPAVINTSEDDLTENDVIYVDIDAVHTTASKGLIVTLECRLP